MSIKLYDLVAAARSGKLHDVVERDAEIDRLVRLLLAPNHHHVAIVAEPGTGKTSLTEALAVRLGRGRYPQLEPRLYRLGTEPIMGLLLDGDSLRQTLSALTQAAAQLAGAIIVVEDVQLLASDDPARLELTLALLQALTAHTCVRVIVTTTQTAYQRIFQSDYVFSRTFDTLELATATPETATRMIEEVLPRLEAAGHQQIADSAVAKAVEYGGRFGHGRALPDAAIRLLEETGVAVSLAGRDTVTAADVQAVVAERERLPIGELDAGRRGQLVDLESALTAAVVGQAPALRTIARTIAKSHVGLGDATRPRGSFLLLGPSGVGKTETAKALARLVFAGPQALVRLDMSEYGEAHAAVRLIGSPPGYVGYEEGGQLTGAVAREPYSLVLLDEIEKAHPKLFDLFLQLLDDGRLTDSAGKTVDFTETLVLATSNTGSREIAAAAQAGVEVNDPAFLRDSLYPLLMETYRPEFINRFDAVLVYQPLAEAHLVALAQRELSQLAARLERVGVSFAVPDAMLAAMLRPLYNPLFGARPVKRLVAQYFETPLADRLIRQKLVGPVTITGDEAWLRDEVAA